MFDRDSFGFRIESGYDSVAKDGMSKGFHVIDGYVITSTKQRPDLGSQN